MSELTNGGALASALRSKASEVREVYSESTVDNQALRDAASLLRVLANVVEGMPLLKALGAPGDWGYDTAIGRGVLELHRAAGVGVDAKPIDTRQLKQTLEAATRCLQRNDWGTAFDRVQDALALLPDGVMACHARGGHCTTRAACADHGRCPHGVMASDTHKVADALWAKQEAVQPPQSDDYQTGYHDALGDLARALGVAIPLKDQQ